MKTLLPLVVLALAAACGGSASLRETATALKAMAPDDAGVAAHDGAALLEDMTAKDAYGCLPPVEQVFAAPPGRLPTKTIRSRLPHYGIYFGPVHYRITTAWVDGGWVWMVKLNIAVDLHADDSSLELPDCRLSKDLDGPVTCRGTPYEEAPGLEACPDSGTFEAPATRRNLERLLAQWSEEAEALYDRDAIRYGLPLRYDFELFASEGASGGRPVDLRLPFRASCGRTPYFQALRSGWSISVLAHELGHYLGLLDEYEALSGITALYPKTPFRGSEQSRMGVSMKRHTRMFPIHHYLVLRRYHCSEPVGRDPYGEVLQAPWSAP